MNAKNRNSHGVKVKDLTISLHGTAFIKAQPFVEAIRYLQKRAYNVKIGLDEYTPSDKFVLQMANIIRDNALFDGTHTRLPNDIMELFYPSKEDIEDNQEADRMEKAVKAGKVKTISSEKLIEQDPLK